MWPLRISQRMSVPGGSFWLGSSSVKVRWARIVCLRWRRATGSTPLKHLQLTQRTPARHFDESAVEDAMLLRLARALNVFENCADQDFAGRRRDESPGAPGADEPLR